MATGLIIASCLGYGLGAIFTCFLLIVMSKVDRWNDEVLVFIGTVVWPLSLAFLVSKWGISLMDAKAESVAANIRKKRATRAS